ncbi:unnamed protein product [Arabidopsis halleri]
MFSVGPKKFSLISLEFFRERTFLNRSCRPVDTGFAVRVC